jgi:hypothetical protein
MKHLRALWPLLAVLAASSASALAAPTYELRMVAKGMTPSGAPAPVLAPNLVLSKSAVNFGLVDLGSTVQETVVLTNTGTGPAVLAVGELAAPFSRTHNCPASLAPQASCEVTGAFTAASTAPAEGVLTIAAAGSATAQLTLSGSGKGVLAIQGFGGYPGFTDTPVGRTVQRDYYITNTSAQSVTITRPVIAGAAYSSLVPCMTTTTRTLAPGASCLERVQFTPSAASRYTGTLSVQQSNGATPASFALDASGVAPAYSSQLVQGATVQISSATNWRVWMRSEVRIDAATGLLVVDGFLTTSGSGSLPIGNYGMVLTGPAGTSSTIHKIVSHLSNRQVSNAVPVVPGSYVLADTGDRYRLSFTIDANLRIGSYSLTNGGVAAGSFTLTEAMD